MQRRTRIFFCLLLATACLGSAAQTPSVAPREQAALQTLANAPSETELHGTIAKLVIFGTRHTLSET